MALTRFTSDASAALGGPDWLRRRRAAAAAAVAGMAAPSAAEEVWRYSGIDAFDLSAYAPAPVPAKTASDEELRTARALADQFGARCGLVVTRNGAVVHLEPAPGAPAGLLEVAGAGPLAAGAAFDEETVAGLDDHDYFVVLGEAFATDVLVVTVLPGATTVDPVVVVHLADPAAGDGALPAAFPRTVVRAGRAAQVGVIELSASTGPRPDAQMLVVPVTDIAGDDGAHISYANLQLLGAATTQISLQSSRLGRDGVLRSFTVGLGGRYARVRTESALNGQGGETSLLAAYLGTGDQVHDFRTLQDHQAPRTNSELLFTGAVADRSRSVYSGLIRIRRGAVRADARQTNHNLVLSEGAHADSVPNLDIDENDVRCSHASTVGPIDEEQRYYLESRGVEPAVAERLIVLGFFADIAGRSPFPGMRQWVETAVGKRLAGRLPAEVEGDALTVGTGGQVGHG
ncbi:MAG: SufB/SufD family protein [Acidimicrobiales bacterium]